MNRLLPIIILLYCYIIDIVFDKSKWSTMNNNEWITTIIQSECVYNSTQSIPTSLWNDGFNNILLTSRYLLSL